jgi:hypothetical protein
MKKGRALLFQDKLMILMAHERLRACMKNKGIKIIEKSIHFFGEKIMKPSAGN